jgi:hypothetical protein
MVELAATLIVGWFAFQIIFPIFALWWIATDPRNFPAQPATPLPTPVPDGARTSYALGRKVGWLMGR